MGIDTYQWNPKHDTDIYKKLEDDFSGFKTENKKHLAKEAGLKYNASTPIIGMIAKLNEHKGVPLFIETIDKLLKLNVQIVLLGIGSGELLEKLKKLNKKYPNFSFRNEYNERFAHQITAGADFILMPNHYAPTGLNALYALNSGTIPIARRTGALSDLLVNYDPKTQHGNAFTFEKHDANELLKTVKSAISLFNEIENWNKLIDNALFADYSWAKSVKLYDEIYKNLIKED